MKSKRERIDHWYVAVAQFISVKQKHITQWRRRNTLRIHGKTRQQSNDWKRLHRACSVGGGDTIKHYTRGKLSLFMLAIHRLWHQKECIQHCWQRMWWWRRWRWRWRWWWSSRARTSPPLNHRQQETSVLFVRVQVQLKQHLWRLTGPLRWLSFFYRCML